MAFTQNCAANRQTIAVDQFSKIHLQGACRSSAIEHTDQKSCSQHQYINIDVPAFAKKISQAKINDVKAVHTHGHWCKDIKAIGNHYQWILLSKLWVPRLTLATISGALAITATALALAGITSAVVTAIATSAGLATIPFIIITLVVTAKAWSERETNKNQFETQLTNEFRNQKNAVLTGLSQDDNQGTLNEFSRKKESMNEHIYRCIRAYCNAVLHEKNQPNITTHEINCAFEILLGDRRSAAMTPLQSKDFREILPSFIIALRQIEEEKNY